MNRLQLIIGLFCGLFVPTLGAESLKVVTSIPPLNALAAGVTEGITQPKMLVPPEASHHHYALKPSERQALEEAQVVIWIGDNMETFLIKPLANLPKETTIISIIDLPKLTRLPLRTNAAWKAHDHDHRDKDMDPHVWLDPQNAIYIAETLADTFSKIDEKNSAQYQKNAEKIKKQITQLDQQLMTELKPMQKKPFIVFHDAYQYFEHHYNLTDVGAISVNTDLPSSVQHILQIQQQIKKDRIYCLFAETGPTPAIIKTLAKQTQTSIGHLDSVGKGNNFIDYLNLLQHNADAFSQCLVR